MHAHALSNECVCSSVSVLRACEWVCLLTAVCMCAQAEWMKELWWHPDREAWVPPVPIGPLALPPDALTDALDAGWWYSQLGGRGGS
jgi:hypothetical protein